MNIIQRIYCRSFQKVFRIAMPILPYRTPVVLTNVNECIPLLNKINVKKVLLVTDSFLRKSGITESLEKSLNLNNIKCIVFDGTNSNPTIKNVEAAKKLYLENNCQALIAFGGGSSMDCAKATGACIAYPKKSLEQMKGLLKVLKSLPPLIAIPTTAGTGSEVTVTAVITDDVKKHKYTMNNFTMIPHYAVLDPQVTYTLPPSLTATTGMDALTHAIEAYIGGSTTRETRKLSIEAIKLIFENIIKAYEDGYNQVARAAMLKAAYKAGIAFSKSYVGYIHSVAHSLGGQYTIPHGFANAVLLPIVLEKYGKSVYKKLYKISVSLNICEKNDSYEIGAKKLIENIRNLNRLMNIPEKIEGIKSEDICKMAKYAAKEANPLYPVPKLMNAKELEQLYYAVMK